MNLLYRLFWGCKQFCRKFGKNLSGIFFQEDDNRGQLKLFPSYAR